MKDRDLLNNELLDNFINNDVRKAYKKYNYMWTCFRKEPLLGVHVSKIIEDGFKKHLHHNDNKVYKKLIINDDLILDKIPFIIKTKSSALNYDYIQLNTIYNSLITIIKENCNNNNNEANRKILINLCNNINRCNFKIRANTFFLVKNKKLSEFGHTRMIVIMPVFIKLYELLIFDDVTNFITNLILPDNYQFGGIKSGSTYKALISLRFKMHNFISKGVILLDMKKGYDSLNLNKLEVMVKKIEDKRIRTLLLNWVYLIWNMDIVINNNLVKRERGVPMGLSLSPAIFVFYIHNIIDDMYKTIGVIYIDDIGFVIPKFYSDKMALNVYKGLIRDLKKYDLIINEDKSVLISDDVGLISVFKNIIPIKDKDKYLGRELKLDSGKIIGDDSFFNNNKFSFNPKWINFAIKRLIFNGALDARFRYKFFMWPTIYVDIRKKIFQKAWRFFRSSFSNYSYVQLCIISNNLLRYLIDPIIFFDINNRLADNIIDKTQANLELINSIKTDLQQIDPILHSIDYNWNKNKIIEADLFNIHKEFCNSAWLSFKKIILENYKNNKMVNNIQVFNNINFESKIIKNCFFILDIIFNHTNKNRRKSFLVWEFLASLQKIYSNWENDKNVIINLDNIKINNVILIPNYNENQWIDFAKRKNISFWPFLDKILALENAAKNNNTHSVKIKKLYNEFELKKTITLSNGFSFKLSQRDYFYDPDIDENFNLKDINKNFVLKHKDISKKKSFNKIFKLFIILDTIYCDNSYNNVTYTELLYNFYTKIDDLDTLASKILKIIDSEENLLFFT